MFLYQRRTIGIERQTQIEEAHEAHVHIADYVGELLVSCGMSNETVELIIPLYELTVAFAITHLVFVGRKGGHLDEIFFAGALGGKGGRRRLEDHLQFFQVMKLGYREGGDGVAAERNDSDQAIIFQASTGFADGRPAGVVVAAKLCFRKGSSRG